MQYNVITTEEQLRDLVEYYLQQDTVVFDVETVGEHRIDPVRNEVLWIALATHGRVDVIPLGHPNGDYIRTDRPLLKVGQDRQAKGLPIRPSDYSRDDKKATKVFTAPPAQLRRGVVFDALKPIFFNYSITLGGHNLKFDLESVTKYYGEVPWGPYFDTMIGSWVLDSRLTGQLSLAACLKREFNHDMVKGVGAEVENYTFDEVAEYAANDAGWTYRLLETLAARLDAERLTNVMRLEMDVLGVISDMELTGAPIDMVELAALKTRLDQEVDDARATIYKVAGKVFNINSNTEKQALLFKPKKEGGRGLRASKFTDGGAPSVAADALERFRGKDELVDALLNYADLNKLLSTYVLPYMGGDVVRTTSGKSKTVTRDSLLINGRVHTNFKQHGAETGRFSSSNPNLQNVPNASTPHGKAIRNLFAAPPGYVFVGADYSQVEPRIITHFSQDPVFVSAYANNVDVYEHIAQPLGLPRKAGKVAVLAMSYGVGPDKVESSLGLPAGEGKELLNAFEKEFRQVYAYKRHVVAEARRRTPVPYVTTITGRRRYLPDLRSSEFRLKGRAERQAFNTLIQGTAADIMKIALVRAHRMLPPEAKMILTVHDEIVTLCPEDMAEQVADIIREAMEGVTFLDVPLVADVNIATRWGDCK